MKHTFSIFLLVLAFLLAACGSEPTEPSRQTLPSLAPAEPVDASAAVPIPGDAVSVRLKQNAVSCDSEAVTFAGGALTITGGGSYVLSGRLEGMVIVDTGEAVQLFLDNATIDSPCSAALYVRKADSVTLCLADGSENALTVSGPFVDIDENNIDAVVFSKDDLILRGTGRLTVSTDYGHGIVSKDALTVEGGALTIQVSGQGMAGKDSVTLRNGSASITSGKAGIRSKNEDDGNLGCISVFAGSWTVAAQEDGLHATNSVSVLGGTLQIASGDDGIHADNRITVSGGSITVSQSYEGLEAQTLDISGGTLRIKASDDGLNATASDNQTGVDSTAEPTILISGGDVLVDADGDGLDSNGSITVSGGTTIVLGPCANDNGPLDYDSQAVITGGTFVALGASGMAQNFGPGSSQCSALVQVGDQNGGTLVLSTNQGEELLTVTTEKWFNCAVVSCPALEVGGSYTLRVGQYTTEFAFDSVIYSQNGFGRPSGNGRPGPGQPPEGDPGQSNGMEPPEGGPGGFGAPMPPENGSGEQPEPPEFDAELPPGEKPPLEEA